MSSAKGIRGQIKSIQSTRKITSAFEMISAGKMKRSKDRMRLSKPYAEKIMQVIGHLAKANTEYRHPFLEQREVKRVGMIVVSSDRGLCGGLNTNLFKAMLKDLKAWDEKGISANLAVIGTKAEGFVKRFGGNLVANLTQLGDKPQVTDFIGLVKVMLDAFHDGKIDALYIASNTFVNTMTQAPTIQQVLPLAPSDDVKTAEHWDYIYEPDAKVLLDTLLTRYIESTVYQAVIENIACEQAARMVAMKSASDNAKTLIDDLQLVYNKARQAAITQEISEIVSGAAAV
ncbi:MAG: ATP synthase gamma chain [marine bacterium B5-7]|nr:MAG: ATP synthase gamma chain [marine bacterium B5-7]